MKLNRNNDCFVCSQSIEQLTNRRKKKLRSGPKKKTHAYNGKNMGKRNLPLSYNEINKTKPKKKTVMVKMVTMQSGMIEKFVFFFFAVEVVN